MYHPELPPAEGTVIRPPNEAGSLIFQITLGCSDNRCVFCPAYKDKPFRAKDPAAVEAELACFGKRYPGTRRVFFADGDALILGYERLARVFAAARTHFPALARIGIYGSVKSVERLSVRELAALKAQGLGTVYLGFETGDGEVYRFIRKHGSPEGNVAACLKLKEAGLRVNATVILGLGGRDLSAQHVDGTVRVVNRARPDQVAALSLMVVPGTPLYEMSRAGRFRLPGPLGYVGELRRLVGGLDDFRCGFFANHASNYLPVSARFPADRRRVLAALDAVLSGEDAGALTPESLRGL